MLLRPRDEVEWQHIAEDREDHHRQPRPAGRRQGIAAQAQVTPDNRRRNQDAPRNEDCRRESRQRQLVKDALYG